MLPSLGAEHGVSGELQAVSNGVITIPEWANKWAAYRFILEAIYDGSDKNYRIGA